MVQFFLTHVVELQHFAKDQTTTVHLQDKFHHYFVNVKLVQDIFVHMAESNVIKAKCLNVKPVVVPSTTQAPKVGVHCTCTSPHPPVAPPKFSYTSTFS